MSVQTQIFFTGKQWVEITYEPILNNDGTMSGHYRELSRKQIIDFGLFDDSEILQNAIDNITFCRNSLRNDLYLLTGFQEEQVIYRAYMFGSEELSTKVIQYLRDRNLVVIEHSPFNPQKNINTISFKCYIREQEGEKDCPIYTITLSGMDDKVIPVA